MRKLLVAVLLVVPIGTAAATLAGADDERPASIDGGGAPVPTTPESTGSIAPNGPSAEADPELDTDLWVGKPVVSADGVEVGTIAAVHLDADGRPIAVTTTIGGILGFGGSDVRLPITGANFDGEELRIGLVETDIAAYASGDPETVVQTRYGTR